MYEYSHSWNWDQLQERWNKFVDSKSTPEAKHLLYLAELMMLATSPITPDKDFKWACRHDRWQLQDFGVVASSAQAGAMKTSLSFMRAAKRVIVYAATSVILESTYKSGGYKANERGLTEVDSHENQAETRRCGYAAIFSHMKYPRDVLEPCDPHSCKVAVRTNTSFALLVIGAKHTEEPSAYFKAIGPSGMDVVHY